jgi:hypothetical protein
MGDAPGEITNNQSFVLLLPLNPLQKAFVIGQLSLVI